MLESSRLMLSLIIYFTYLNANGEGNFIDDYCWRDYDGIMPLDGLKAGVDKTGATIYIGQTLFQNKLIPGKIHENASELHFEFHVARTVNETIKILCTSHPERFEWVQTHYEQIVNMKDKMLFEGGYEKGYHTYVGRAFSHGESTVGKVVCFETGCYKLTTIENGTWYDHAEFEILTYNPDAPATAVSPNPTVVVPPTPSVETPAIAPNSTATVASPSTSQEHRHTEVHSKPSFLTYFFLVVVLAALVVLVIVLVRRC